ncbi:hypothetical protein M8494_01300 [Serratia ureilytica]
MPVTLRIMRHEQLNWTATLAGLLHMQRATTRPFAMGKPGRRGGAGKSSISSRSASVRRRCAACC